MKRILQWRWVDSVYWCSIHCFIASNSFIFNVRLVLFLVSPKETLWMNLSNQWAANERFSEFWLQTMVTKFSFSYCFSILISPGTLLFFILKYDYVLATFTGMAATKAILSMRQWAYYNLGDERAIEFVALATRVRKYKWIIKTFLFVSSGRILLFCSQLLGDHSCGIRYWLICINLLCCWVAKEI